MALVKNLSFALVSAGFAVVATATQALSLSLTYDSSIGSPGFAPGQLFVPQGIAVQEGTGNVYVSNGRGINPANGTSDPNVGNKVEIYNPQGTYIGAVGSGGTGPGQFDEPSALEFDPQTGNLYVGDVYNNRVSQFDSQGNFIRSFGEFTPLKEGRAFFGPSGVTFDKAGNVYVGDFDGDKINKYTKSGELLGSIGGITGSGLGEFQGVAGVRISPVSGNIYVSDQFNNRVQVLDPNGKALFAFGTQGIGDGQFLQPIGLEVDEQENIYVADSINSRVQVFDKNGKFLTAYGKPALDASGNVVPPPALTGPPFGDPLDLRPGRFNWTGGTALKDGKLYVGDFFQGRVQVLKVENGARVPEPSTTLAIGLLAAGAVAIKLKKDKRQRTIISLEKQFQKNIV